jgi:quinol monooxygenase YgiN
MSSVVSWNLQLSVNDGQLDNFISLMHEMVSATRAEAGTQAYEWYLSEDRATCHICERYTDSDAVMVHLGAFGANFAERFLACVTPTAFFVYGDPSADARAALDGFGAAYYGTLGGFTR